MPVHTYTNWNQRPSDQEEQIEPFRKYFFICEGANTETFYFKHLIDLRKELGIHPLIDIRLWEKTEEDKNISFAKRLVDFRYKSFQPVKIRFKTCSDLISNQSAQFGIAKSKPPALRDSIGFILEPLRIKLIPVGKEVILKDLTVQSSHAVGCVGGVYSEFRHVNTSIQNDAE